MERAVVRVPRYRAFMRYITNGERTPLSYYYSSVFWYLSKMINIFAYGSLMFDAVRDQLIDDRYRELEGYVSGFRRLKVRDEVYPGLIASMGSRVDGVVLLGVTSSDIRLLDRFEGAYYRRQGVTVVCGDNHCVRAQAYVFSDEYRILLTDTEWDVKQFCDKNLQTFMSRYQGFNRV